MPQLARDETSAASDSSDRLPGGHDRHRLSQLCAFRSNTDALDVMMPAYGSGQPRRRGS